MPSLTCHGDFTMSTGNTYNITKMMAGEESFSFRDHVRIFFISLGSVFGVSSQAQLNDKEFYDQVSKITTLAAEIFSFCKPILAKAEAVDKGAVQELVENPKLPGLYGLYREMLKPALEIAEEDIDEATKLIGRCYQAVNQRLGGNNSEIVDISTQRVPIKRGRDYSKVSDELMQPGKIGYERQKRELATAKRQEKERQEKI